MKTGPALFAAGWLAAAASAQTQSASRYRSGPVPVLPSVSASVGGGQVLLEVTVGPGGAVAGITPLRTTASFTELTIGAVRNWRFTPPRGGQSKVLVAAVFRPPTLNTPTLGEPVQDAAAGSADIPFPQSIVTPPFPPRARSAGVVLVEAEVEMSGAVANARVLHAAAGFDAAAVDAARRWRFRPARLSGQPVKSFAYILFGFPVPRS